MKTIFQWLEYNKIDKKTKMIEKIEEKNWYSSYDKMMGTQLIKLIKIIIVEKYCASSVYSYISYSELLFNHDLWS